MTRLCVIPLVGLLALIFAASAGAAQLVELSSFGQQKGELGGQVQNASGLAVNRSGVGGVEAGTVYVGEWGNRRIDQFNKEGQFIRTWGKDVNATEPGTGFEVCTAASGDTCKKGAVSEEAGAVNNPRGIAVDPRSGNIYVLENGTNRIDVFSPDGQFEGALGYGVDASAPAAELQFCTVSSGCQEGQHTSAAGGFAFILGAIAVDPTNNDLWVGDPSNHRINEFSVTLNGAKEAVAASFVRALGWNIDSGGPAEELQECTTLTGCQAGTGGRGPGQITSPISMAVAPSGDIYVAEGSCSAASPCEVTKFNPGGNFKEQFGPDEGGTDNCQLTVSDGSSGATSVAVDPGSEDVILTLASDTGTYQICEFTGAGELLSRSPVESLSTASGSAIFETAELNVALGEGESVLVQTPNKSGTSWPVTTFGLVPGAPAEIQPVTDLEATSATLNGQVTIPAPGGPGYDVKYRFEYSANNGTTWLRVPTGALAAVGSTVPGPHAVQQSVVGLQPNTIYRDRLVTITSFTTTSQEGTFQTPAGPALIEEVRSRDAEQSSVTLEAHINPNGSSTTYRFEWGTTPGYGNVAPELEPSLGAGHEASRVTADLTGLADGSTYHYRIVARSGIFVSTSPDQTFETLNSCGLPEGRCFELVSPPDAGPTDLPGAYAGSVELHFQAARRPGALAYVSETGTPSATKGAEVLSRAALGPDGWASTQLSPPLVAQTETAGGSSASSQYQAMNEELSCGVVASDQPLTSDPGSLVAIEEGASNLYLQSAGGGYTAISAQAPTNLSTALEPLLGSFAVRALSEDCNKVVFETPYVYPGVAAAESPQHLYEWADGRLTTVTYASGPSGEVVAGAFVGASADGSRVFFSNGEGLFVREEGQVTRKVSISQTSVPDTNPVFQSATSDGTRVFFTAGAGLTADSSSEGRDLYEYDLNTEVLTDLSPSAEQGGAEVVGFIGASADGSRVYFVAEGQLEPGAGKTLTENRADRSYSIYSEEGGNVGFVATYNERTPTAPLEGLVYESAGTTRSAKTSRVSADGEFLLFESSGDVTGYESGHVLEAYLYDAGGEGSAAVSCVSCRPDGTGSKTPVLNHLLASSLETSNSLSEPSSLAVIGGRPVVFFNSFDSLATGAGEGDSNVYEWAHGQVFLIAVEPPGLASTDASAGLAEGTQYVGSSEDGVDLYIRTPESLTWEDGDGRSSIYDARSGGGFPQPPPPPAPCDPVREASCQGSGGVSGVAVPSAASQNFTGPGNQKHHKKNQKKKKHQKKKHQKKAKRPVKDRGAGK